MSLKFAFSLIGCLLIANLNSTAADEKNPSTRWESTIQKFEQADKKQSPPKGAILFVGSSSIRLWDLENSFPEHTVINRGFGGSEVADSLFYADRIVTKHQPRQVVMYAGDNDIAHNKTPETVARDFRQFVKKVRQELPNVPIAYIAIKPSLSRWKLAETMKEANALIEQQCEANENLEYIDVWNPMIGKDGKPRPELFRDDGLHLNKKGYTLWNSLVEPVLVDE
ncbi:SGNH/GDSL hydrolase family protein [Thalassoroseus pseudoceratinae]|uniref:SGNH/GDSL hydrolase family protein n=1 Tax=Thalassoroseus pseudoceratinae TaxID=2713176 RepID=UPI001423382A|nr:SGNH/GDSL hydrolase family protein [Thalassoroseus pseudoceratinae]